VTDPQNWMAGLVLLTICSGAIADDDHLKAKRLHQSGDIVSIEQILSKVRQSNQGRVLEIDLEDEEGRYLYEIELVDSKGDVHKFLFDARTGEQISETLKNKGKKRDD
jgi:uncharacterized membrane protein YkoI